MKRNPKLVLRRETLATLVSDELLAVAAGAPSVLGCTDTCNISDGVCLTYTCPSDRCTEFCTVLSHAGRCA